MKRRPLASGAAAIVALLVAPLLRADSASDELIKRGIEMRRGQRDAEALEVFRRAYALDHSPRARSQMGFAEQATGDWVAAESDLAGSLEATSDAWVARNRAAVVAALEDVRDHLASIDVVAAVPDATLWINGAERGHLPLASPVRAPIGEATLTVRAAGYEPFEERVSLTPRASLRVWVPLRAVAAPADLPQTLGPALVLLPPRSSSAPREAAAAESARPVGWALLVASGVVAAGAAAAQVAGNANASVWNDDGRCLYGALSRGERCGAYGARADAYHALAIVGAATAAAGLIGSVVILTTSPKAPARSAGRVTCGPTGGAWGIACDGAF